MQEDYDLDLAGHNDEDGLLTKLKEMDARDFVAKICLGYKKLTGKFGNLLKVLKQV